MSQQIDPNNPPSMGQITQNAVGKAAGDMAVNHARRAVVGKIKSYLPKFLWPLIPGEGGDVVTNIKKAAVEKTWAVVGGCLFSLFFFAAFGIAIAGFLLLTAGPMVASLYFAFTDYNLFDAPRWIGLDNFSEMFADPRWQNSVKVTLWYVAVGTPINPYALK